METKETFDTLAAIRAQEKYCDENHVPHFAPHGRCYSCGRDIYASPNGYSVEYAASHLITGCPYCFMSYCE